MPRIGFKNKRIKAIIFHTNTNQKLDEPIIYNLDDGKHVCNMPRAPRTNYRKKEKPLSQQKYKPRKPKPKKSNLVSSESNLTINFNDSSNNCENEKKCIEITETLMNETKKEFFTKLFDIVAEQIIADDYFINSDFEE